MNRAKKFMFNKIIEIFLKKRHFWRYATFTEISELYTSRTLRIIAMNMSAGFTSIYLFQFGYSIANIFLLWSLYYLLRIVLMPLSAQFVAYFGPKHGIFISNLLYIPALVALASMPKIGFMATIIWGIFTAMSVCLYVVCYYTDFSKVKNVDHAGKEIGYMAIFEKLALAVSPIIGGFLAIIFNPQAVMWISAIVIALAALPLLSSAEPTRTHQKLDFKGFPWKLSLGSYRTEIGAGFDTMASNQVWSVYLASVVFASAGVSIYLDVGSLAAFTILVGLAVSYIYGRIVDTKKGGKLLFYSVMLNSLTHGLRPFVNTPASAIGINMINETATTGVSLSRLRGLFDIADSSGHRILFFTGLEIMLSIGAGLAALTLYFLLSIFPVITGFAFFYVVTAVVVLIMATYKFPVYQR